MPQLDRNRLRTLGAAWPRLADLDQDLVVPHVDQAIADLDRLNVRHESYMSKGTERVRDTAARFVAGEVDFADAVTAAFLSASTDTLRAAARDLTSAAERHILDRAQRALLDNGKTLHQMLRDEYARIVARAVELAPAVEGLDSGDQALHAAPGPRSAWVELVDLAERRQAIRDAHAALRGVYIWGAVPHLLDHRFFEYADLTPALRSDDPVLVLVADSISPTRLPALYRVHEAIEHQKRWEKGIPPDPELVIGVVDADEAAALKRLNERKHGVATA